MSPRLSQARPRSRVLQRDRGLEQLQHAPMALTDTCCIHMDTQQHINLLADRSCDAFRLATLPTRASAKATMRTYPGQRRAVFPHHELVETQRQRLLGKGLLEAPSGRQRIGRCMRSHGTKRLDTVQSLDHCRHPGGRPAQKLRADLCGVRDIDIVCTREIERLMGLLALVAS